MAYWNDYVEFSILKGKTLKQVAVNDTNDEIVFTTDGDEVFRMYHSQDCCESVIIDDICGDIQVLIGSPILVAEERCSDEAPEHIASERTAAKEKALANDEYYYDCVESETWTFYELATIKGNVTIRWHGSSNGYYSESVSFEKVNK